MLFELIMGKRPYYGKARKEIREQMVAKEVKLDRSMCDDEEWSYECIDFCNKITRRKPYKRLGYEGFGEIAAHPWFKDYPWNKVESKTLTSPFQPNVKTQKLAKF